MNKRLKVRLIIVSLIAGLSLVGLILGSLQTEQPSSNRLSSTNRLFPFTAEQIQTIQIMNSQDQYCLEWQNQEVTIADIPSPLIVRPYAELLREQLANLNYSTKLTAINQVDLEDYGLARPTAEVRFKLEDHEEWNFIIGDLEPISQSHYVQVKGETEVYLIRRKQLLRCMMPATKYINYMITAPEKSDGIKALDYLRISGQGFVEPIIIERVSSNSKLRLRQAQSFGAASHIVVQPYVYEVNQTELRDLTDSLFGLISEQVLAYNCSAAELTEYGFDQPLMSLDYIYQAAEEEKPVKQGLKVIAKEGHYLATVTGRGVIYQIADVGFIHSTSQKLLSDWFIGPLLMDLESVTVDLAGQQYRFELKPSQEKKIEVICQGKSIEFSEFSKYYNLLVSATREGEIKRVSPKEMQRREKRLEIKYGYRTEDKPEETMTFYNWQARRVAAVMNRQTQTVVRQSYVEAVEKATVALLAGQSFSTNWQ